MMMKHFITLLAFTVLSLGFGYGQTCSQAFNLSCNQTYSSNTKDLANTFNANSYGACYNGNSSFNGRDGVYKVTVATGNTLVVDIWNLTGDVDLFVFDNCDGTALYNCKGSSLNSNNTSEKVTVNNASGTYYIVVDGYNNDITSEFLIRTTCTTVTDNSPCRGGNNPDIVGYVSEDLGCGDRVTGSNSGKGNNYISYDCFDGSFPGADVFYELYIPQTTDISISLTGLSADLDLFLIRCNNGATNCIRSSTGPNNSNEQINVTNAQGYYFILIDAQYTSSISSFILDIDCNDDDFSCADATRLECGRSYNSTTIGGSNNFVYNDLGACASGISQSNNPFTGNDKLYRIDVPSGSSNLTISMTGLSKDLDIFLFDQCQSYSNNPATLSTCVARSTNGSNQNEQITLNNAGGTYYLLVDGHKPDQVSNFRLLIGCDACEEETNSNCSSMSYQYVNNNSGFLYSFSVANNLPATGVWTVQRVGSSQISTSVGGRTTNANFSSSGTYIVCYSYVKSDGCEGSCCKTVYISNPYDCDDIFYSYNQNSNSYTLNIPGITNATWQDDDNNTIIGTGTTVNVPVSGSCRVRNFSVQFYDPGLNAYRICCISLYMCDPYDCDDITYGYNQNSNSYTLSIPGITNATWYDDDNNSTIGSGTTVSVSVSGSCRVRNFSVRFYDPAVNAYRICCINIYMCNPYDCDDITYGYSQSSNSYVLNIPGITNANWYDDDANTYIGSGTTVSVPVTSGCRVRNFSVRFYDPAVNAYRICCIRIYMCDPYDCNNITYGYNQNTNNYTLNIPGISTGNWYDDDTNTYIGTGTTVNVPVSGSCRARNFSVRFYDPAVNAYRICCIRIYICDPYDCNNLQETYNSNNNTWSLSLPGLSSSNVLFWKDDATGQQIAGSTSNISINNPAPGQCRYISVHYFDPSSNCYRVCCLQICAPANTPDCDDLVFSYVGTSRYSFSVPNDFPSGSWTAQGGGNTVGIGSGRTAVYTFPQPGVYNICYRYTQNGVTRECCKRISIVGNPYDCDDITYGYNNSTSNYELNIPGITDANVAYWQDDDNNTVIGYNSTVAVNVSGTCRVRNFSVVFFDAAVNAYRICCISIYVCNPYDCDNITYSYNNTNNSYLLSIPGISNASWYDDDTNTYLGAGTNVSVPVGTGCGIRNFSVRFYDPAVNAYRICCIAIYVCNPYNCNSISESYNAGSNTYTLALSGISGAQVLSWRNDDTGQQIAAGTSSITINNPASGSCIAISVLFYDPAINGYRVCCLEICNDDPGACAGITNESLTCKNDGTYDYSFTLNNNSGQTVDAIFSMVSPIGVTFNNCTLKRQISNVGTSQTITLNIDDCLVSLSAGMQIVYELTLQEAGKEEGWCCHLGETTITLPECGDPCQGDPQDIVCTDVYQPVCGCDGVTYSNSCYAARAGVQSVVGGACDTGGGGCDDSSKLDLVTNGNFSGGNWGFVSDFANGCYCAQNTYCVQTNARNKCGGWNSVVSTGNFLMIDAGAGSPDVVWEQDVTVQAGVEYTFCFDMFRNLSSGSSPVLRLQVNNDMLGGAAPGQNNQWVTYSRTWTATSSGSVTLSIQQVSTAGGSDDFGIDNIGMKYCPDDLIPERDEILSVKSDEVDLLAAPNPFTDATTISFTLSSDMPATVSIFNMDGKQVFEQKGNFDEGLNTIDFTTEGKLSAGIYYYRLETAEQTLTKSMILMKR